MSRREKAGPWCLGLLYGNFGTGGINFFLPTFPYSASVLCRISEHGCMHEIQQTFNANLHERNCKVSVGTACTALRWPYFRLNTNGSRGINEKASAGGLIHYANGN